MKEAKLDNKTDKKEKVQMRNIISASKTRLKKKFEMKYLYNLAKNKDQGIDRFMKIVLENLQDRPEILEGIRQDMARVEVADPDS